MDEIVEVEHKGFLSNILDSIKSAIAGILLFLISFAVIWWNEGNYKGEQDLNKEIKSSLVRGTPRTPNSTYW